MSNVTQNMDAIDEIYLDHLLSIYPNPNNGTFTFQLNGVDYRSAEIRLFNLLGEEVYQAIITGKRSEITLSSVPKGMYQLQMVTDKGTARKKIVIQ